MKKILSYILFLAVVAIAGTGCLKDKGFENHEYGINDPDNQPVGIGFPEGKNAINIRGINFVSTAQTVTFVVSLFGTNPASSDIHVNLVANPSLVTAYNTANGTTYVALPAGSFNYTNIKVTIPAGQRYGTFTMNIPSALTTLSPLASYAMGFTIASVDEPGYTIASNLKDIIVGITVKNKYDGVYTYKATYDFPADRPATWLTTQFTYPYETALITTGPNSVSFYNDAYGAGLIPLMAPGVSGFGGTAMDIVFGANDKVVSVNNPAPDSRNRQFTLRAGGNSRYDAASKTLFLEIIFTQNGQLPTPMHIQMIYKRAR